MPQKTAYGFAVASCYVPEPGRYCFSYAIRMNESCKAKNLFTVVLDQKILKQRKIHKKSGYRLLATETFVAEVESGGFITLFSENKQPQNAHTGTDFSILAERIF